MYSRKFTPFISFSVATITALAAHVGAQSASKAAPSDAPQVIKLPAVVEASCAAGGGKYLLLHLKSVRQLAVFDTEQSKVVKYLPLPTSDVAIAGSASPNDGIRGGNGQTISSRTTRANSSPVSVRP